MTDKEYVKTYAVGMFMLTFLDEWKDLEKIGIVAKIFNTITKKHNVFHKQILEVQQKKRKKLSKKATLYVFAEKIAIESYNNALKKQESKRRIVTNTTIRHLYNLSRENIEHIYGLKEEDFKKLDNRKHNNILQSCGVATMLTEELDITIKQKTGKVEKENADK